MRRIGRTILHLAVLTCVAGGWGCSADGPGRGVVWDDQAVAGETFTVNSARFVLGGTGGETAGGVEPWWLTRNDARLNAHGGGTRGEVVRYMVEVEDRQRSHPGHINNTYRRTFDSRRYGEVVR